MRTAFESFSIEGQGSARDDAVQMDVAFHRLAPRMKDGGDADFPVPVAGGKSLQRLRRGGEQQIVDELVVPCRPVVDRMRQREDGVKVGDRQQLVFSGFDPALLFEPLAFRAVAVATGVVAVFGGAAVGTEVDMAAQRGGATVSDGAEYLVDVQGMIVAAEVLG